MMLSIPVFSILLVLPFWIICILPVKSATTFQCDRKFSSKCLCGTIKYENKMQYVVNCTNTQFQDASVLQNLPPETQVLLFRGNNITELPTNLFGIENTFDDLKVVDMSDNNIREIRGKSFHRVSKVERLILNHNEITISQEPSHNHPRVFSNFENLIELHLTNAFADGTFTASDLHDIFVNSELKELRKLHIEQNEIDDFKDPKVFCDLPQLQDLHIGQNNLKGVHFDLDCLPHLRFIDLEVNKIESLSGDQLTALDDYTDLYNNHTLTIDLSQNNLSKGCSQFYSWLQSTKVVVRNKESLKCHERPKLTAPPPCSASHSATELCLWVALSAAIALLLYQNRKPIEHQMRPLVDALSRKVHYTNLGKNDEQEMNV